MSFFKYNFGAFYWLNCFFPSEWDVLYILPIPTVFATKHGIFAKVTNSQNISIKLRKSFTNNQIIAQVWILRRYKENLAISVFFPLKTDFLQILSKAVSKPKLKEAGFSTRKTGICLRSQRLALPHWWLLPTKPGLQGRGMSHSLVVLLGYLMSGPFLKAS